MELTQDCNDSFFSDHVGSGKNAWDFANGEECIKEFGALTCDQYNASTASPPPCSNACKQK